ncbi:AzlC family ABC transporter permease [Halobacterium sp. R2-5]|uniref:AzlC family ABC transporter permease n=1 Tax=Halobacterium sp. R2-5 TaxID=2715751 RepID=UPI00141F9FB3|nr:branched-chain amino acid ABC transporter permease [Halobacterium sp. R2-5]
MTQREDFVAGLRDSLPTLPANVPFGFVVGAAAVQVGFGDVQTVAMSAAVFGGASQLAAIDLVGSGAPLAVVVLTAVVVNLRYTMYSAAIAPHFRRLPERWRLVCAQFLIDATFALAVTEYERSEDTDRLAYYLGVALAIYLTYVGGTVAGVAFGNRMPAGLQLDFAIPLLFLALLVPSITDEPTAVAAAVGGFVAVAAAGAPMNLGIIAAGLSGVVTAVAASETGVGQ